VGDEVSDALRLVDLHVVPRPRDQVQLALREQRGELEGDMRIEVPVVSPASVGAMRGGADQT